MRKTACLLVCLLVMLALAEACFGEEQTGTVAKVTTARGALKLRSRPDDRARVLDEIPNGTCVLVLPEGSEWSQVVFGNKTGYCKTDFLTFLQGADPSILTYRVLRKGNRGDDVLAVKRRLQELGYIRSGADLTNIYNDTLAERVTLFQRQTGMTEDGVASQELQAYLFSDKAPVCTQTLPKVRFRVPQSGENRVFCGCCFGEGCECCGFTGWITY